MRFILVNERVPRGSSACACCSQPFGKGYLRGVPSNRVYCSYQCFSQDGKAGEWCFDSSGHLVPSPIGQSGLHVDWASPRQ